MARAMYCADLFCGAGGTSTGFLQACEEFGAKPHLIAINHWQVAVNSHAANHPWAEHLCTGLQDVKPSKLVPGGKLDLLVASPECTHHSTARGGKPRNDQSRASAWLILHWLQELYVRNVIIENVPEFVQWGPLDSRGQPLKSKRGETFRAFVTALESLGYRVSWRILNAANYGDATTRRRFFLRAHRGNRRVVWPEPTHAQAGGKNLFGETLAWVPAREIIDWTIPGRSIFGRKHPLADNTLKRIEAGISKFWGEWADPFLVVLRGTNQDRLSATALPVSVPVPTITASGGHVGLVQPFIMNQDQRGVNRGIDEPIPTIATAGAHALVEPFLVKYYGTGGAVDAEAPLDTLTAKSRFGLVEGDACSLDIRFRMLQPHELAAAHSFPKSYIFTGNKTEQIKQIGNSVPVGQARALCASVFAA